MTASYPSTVKSFTTKVDFADTVLAEHVNSLQLEVTSIETVLGTSIRTGSGWVGTFDTVTSSWNTLKDRIANIEYGLSDIHTAVPAGGSTGQVLTKTSGSDYETSWSTISVLPSQSTNAGKFLTTDGSVASWATVAQGGETISSFLLAGC